MHVCMYESKSERVYFDSLVKVFCQQQGSSLLDFCICREFSMDGACIYVCIYVLLSTVR